MRHGKKFNHLGRTAAHRGAMLSNMASSLILNKRVSTTVAKAKALRKYVEPLITKSKLDNTHSRRTVFSYLQNKESIKVLFDEVAEKIATRPGGYTRILKTGNRLGDNAEMCIIELVDYNEALLKETSTKPKTRRSRRGGKGKGKAEAAAPTGASAEEVKEESKPKETKEQEQQAAVADDTSSEPKVAKPEAEEGKEEVKPESKEAKEDKAEAKEAKPETEETTEVKSESAENKETKPEDKSEGDKKEDSADDEEDTNKK